MEDFTCQYRRAHEGSVMPELHRHDGSHEIYYLSSGERRFFTSDKVYYLNSGAFVFIRSGVLHRTSNIKRGAHSRYYAKIPESWLEDIQSLLPDSFAVSEAWPLELLFAKLIKEVEDDTFLSDVMIKNICREIVIDALRLARTKPEEGLVESTIDYIRNNLDSPLGLKEVAEVAGLSPSYFSAEFHRRAGMTFSDSIRMVRIQKASELLEEGFLSVSEISERVGFKDPGYFSSVFRSVMKISPKEYQKRYKGTVL